MKKKILIIIITILFTNSCGFTPIYQNKENNSFSINRISFTGDETLNNFLKSNLNKYNNKNSKKKINLDVITIYEKIILTKDVSGKANKYELRANTIFTIDSSNQKFVFTEKKIMENMNNKSDERKYEISVKQVFANTISNNLIQALITF